jgi:Protein of unknown function (DUF3102)
MAFNRNPATQERGGASGVVLAAKRNSREDKATTTTKQAPAETLLAEHAAAIRRLGKRVVADVIEIGARLTECKRICGHGNWLPWLKREFGWKEQTARNYMAVHALSLKSPTVGDLDIPMRGLYLLAAPSTPETVKTEIIARAEAGEPVLVAEVERVVQKHKGGSRRAMLHRRMKLGDQVVDKLKGTTLDRADELDELVILNRGAPEGGHTEIVKRLVADAIDGKPVSAVAVYLKKNAATAPPPGQASDATRGGDDIEVEIDPDPDTRRTAFMLRADQARLFAVYSGPIDDGVLAIAREALAAWTLLVQRLERGDHAPAPTPPPAPDDDFCIPPFLDRRAAP